jgi:hypothetical protein
MDSSQSLLQRTTSEKPVPYSSEAMRQDLQRLRNVWTDLQANRNRAAIYAYLDAVYGLVAWWRAEGREIERACRAVRLGRLEAFDHEDPFAAVIRCTADPVKADKRTRSKWSRVLRYAAEYKDLAEPLGQFIGRKGGINECAARFARRLRRLPSSQRASRRGKRCARETYEENGISS